MKFKQSILLLSVIFFTSVLNAQSIRVSGNVFSFRGDKVFLLKKAHKNISFDGPLDKVSVTVSNEKSTSQITTGMNGFFSISLPEPGNFKVVLQRQGYSTIEFNINYSDAGKKKGFESLLFILKQDDKAVMKIGTLEIKNGGSLIYSPDNSISEKSKNNIYESNENLLEKASVINNSTVSKFTDHIPGDNISSNEKKEKKQLIKTTDTVVPKLRLAQDLGNLFLLKEADNSNVDSLTNQLNNAKKMQLRYDKTSIEYKFLQSQVTIAEQHLKDKQLIIDINNKDIALTKTKIELANKVIVYVSLLAVLALLSILFLLYFLRQRKLYAAAIKEKSDKISKINSKLLSSIRYASLIQSSFLQDKKKLRNLFSDCFVFNQPKDILSGDFYWFSHKNGRKIIVAADCTGHGVPGAMLTVLGHNMLDEIINTRGEILPGKILFALNQSIQSTFAHHAEHLEYGMDISVISIKDNSTELLFSGITNGLYILSGDKMNRYTVTPKSLGADLTEKDLTDQKIDLNKNDCVFMCTDGYADQFSKNKTKIEKFNVSRFEELLKKIGKEKNLDEAESVLQNDLTEWKGDCEQVDDILVIGFRN